MDYKIFISSVRKVLDELKSTGSSFEEDLESLIKECSIHALRIILQKCPLHVCGDGIEIPGTPGIEILPNGNKKVRFEIPSDFLRIKEVKMSDWNYALSASGDANSSDYHIQWSPISGIGGCPSRPMCFVGNGIELFSSKESAVAIKKYIPLYEWESENLPLHESLESSLIYCTASLCSSTWNEAEEAARLMEIGLSYIK